MLREPLAQNVALMLLVVERVGEAVIVREPLVVGQSVGDCEPDLERVLETLLVGQRLGVRLPVVLEDRQRVDEIVRLCVGD